MILILGLTLVLAGATLLAEFFVNLSVKFEFLISFRNKVSTFFGFVVFFVGVTAFFAPSPTYFTDEVYRFVGDLIPSLVAMVTGLILEARILRFFQLPFSFQEKVQSFLDLILPFWGWVCLSVGVFHLLFGKNIFL